MSTVNLVNVPFAVHNLHGPEKDAKKRHAAIALFLSAVTGGIGGFNELNSGDRAHLKTEAAKRGLSVHIQGYNGMVWDPTLHTVGAPRIKKIMEGGYVGADGVATPQKGDDDRRVGPSRYALYYPVHTIAVALDWEFVVTHLMARSFTLNKWRQPLFWRSVHELADGLLDPDFVVVGDMNHTQRTDLPGWEEVDVAVPNDMGHQKYTRVQRHGQHIYVGRLRAVNTPSDHHMIVGQLTLYRLPQDKLGAPVVQPTPRPDLPAPKPPVVVKPNLPKPGDGKVDWRKYGAPVRHPWVDRSAKWKRRNKKKWAKIEKWQTAYRRRL